MWVAVKRSLIFLLPGADGQSLATGRVTLLISFHHRRSASAWAMPNSTLEQQCAEVSGRASRACCNSIVVVPARDNSK